MFQSLPAPLIIVRPTLRCGARADSIQTIRGEARKCRPEYYSTNNMNWVLYLVLLLTATAGTTQALPGGFGEAARQAEQARTSGHLPDAIQLYRKAVQLRPDWSEGWQSLATIYYEQERFPEAKQAFEHYIATGKDVELAYAYLGLCEYEMRDYEHASEHLSRWIGKGAIGDEQLTDAASVRWSELRTKEGRFVEALYLLDKVAARHGPDPALVEAMGLAWMHMKYLPEDYPPERREVVWLAGSAAAWVAARKPERSHEFLDRLADYYSQEPSVHFLRGFVYESEHRDEDAQKEYREELKISPDYTAALVELSLLDVQLGKLDEAGDVASHAVAIEPNNAQPHYAFGRVLLAEKKWAESAAELQKAKQIAPNAAEVHFHLATVYRQLGRGADAAREDAAFKALKSKQDSLTFSEDREHTAPDER